MGTRSNTVVIETGNGAEYILLNMCRQMDGYLSGHGADLLAFMDGMRLCNGIGLQNDTEKLANGAGCFAAQLIAHFKDGVGGFYIERPLKSHAVCVNDYTYVIRIDTYAPSGIDLQVFEWKKQIFRGNVNGFKLLLEADAVTA
jgi:hypothetical protein